METLNNIVLTIQDYLSNYILIVALVGGGIWFSIRTGFIQVRGFTEGLRRTFGGLFSKKGEAGKDGMSSFQALATAIAAQVGTGNIAGAATAIAIGGPGAVFWMWVAAFLGMATIYCEAIMAQKYKKVGSDGIITGGPVYYIRAAFKGTFGRVLAAIFAVLLIFALGFMGNAVQSNSIASSFHTAFGIPHWITGVVVAVIALLDRKSTLLNSSHVSSSTFVLNPFPTRRSSDLPVYYIRAAFKGTFGRVLAAIFAVLLIFALGFMGNAVQSNSIASSFHTAFGIPQWITGVVVAVIALFIFTGGMKRIAKVTELMVPLMAALYIVGSLIIIIYNWRNIPL